MTMKEAVLEVNHWCHEKVTYRGTDGQVPHSPLATGKDSLRPTRRGVRLHDVAALRAVRNPCPPVLHAPPGARRR
ncbi:MAG: hypothetical protein M0C28_41260 [Candidatus Moduliflexus flocculans]|nr:hypothetical protein [Candidatus Moduliflexus flocculans]